MSEAFLKKYERKSYLKNPLLTRSPAVARIDAALARMQRDKHGALVAAITGGDNEAAKTARKLQETQNILESVKHEIDS